MASRQSLPTASTASGEFSHRRIMEQHLETTRQGVDIPPTLTLPGNGISDDPGLNEHSSSLMESSSKDGLGNEEEKAEDDSSSSCKAPATEL